MEIHCPARCSCDQDLLNSSGNVHYLVGAGIGGWFVGTIVWFMNAALAQRRNGP